MIKNDVWIKSQEGMITPFQPSLIRRVESLQNQPVISYGLSSYGYDIRLSPSQFCVFRRIPGTVIDPKNFNLDNLEPATLHTNDQGNYFIRPHSLGTLIEWKPFTEYAQSRAAIRVPTRWGH